LGPKQCQKERRLKKKTSSLPLAFFLFKPLTQYTLLLTTFQAEDVFYRALKAGGASAKEELSRLCAPTQSSWNIMLDGYVHYDMTHTDTARSSQEQFFYLF